MVKNEISPGDQNTYTRSGQLLWPFAGIVLFVILYIVAAMLYPGGSQADKHSRGFSWLNNYWCNLLNGKAMNGQVNVGQPLAIAAMFILCLSLAVFWYQFAGAMNFKASVRKSIRVSGILSMITGLFLFSKSHDSIINISGALGMFAVVGTFVGLYRNKWLALFWFGLFNIALVGINNLLYYTQQLVYLPVVQKITFLSLLLWVSLIIIKLYNEKRKSV